MKNIEYLSGLDNQRFVRFVQRGICPAINFFETELDVPPFHSENYPNLFPAGLPRGLGFSLWMVRNYKKKNVFRRGLAILLDHLGSELETPPYQGVRAYEKWLDDPYKEDDSVWSVLFKAYQQPVLIDEQFVTIQPQNQQMIVGAKVPQFTSGFEVGYEIGLSEMRYKKADKGQTSVLVSDLPNNTEISVYVRSYCDDGAVSSFTKERKITLRGV